MATQSSIQDSCLENPEDRGTWEATVLRIAKSWTELKRLSTQLLQSDLCSDNEFSIQCLLTLSSHLVPK